MNAVLCFFSVVVISCGFAKISDEDNEVTKTNLAGNYVNEQIYSSPGSADFTADKNYKDITANGRSKINYSFPNNEDEITKTSTTEDLSILSTDFTSTFSPSTEESLEKYYSRIENAKEQEENTVSTDFTSTFPPSTEESLEKYSRIENAKEQEENTGSTDLSTNSDVSTAEIPPSTTLDVCSNPDSIPKIETLLVEAINFEMVLEWEAPQNTECVEEYVIYLNDKESQRTSNLSLSVDVTEACTAYTIGIAASYGTMIGERTEQNVISAVPTPFNYTVENLTVTEYSSLNISWLPPLDNVIKCVTGYNLIWWGVSEGYPNSTQTVYLDASVTYSEIPLIGCLEYGIQVTPKVNNTDGNPEQKTYTAKSIEPSAPINRSMKRDKTYVNVTWEADSRSKNYCPLRNIIVTCVAPTDNNSNYSWIIWSPPPEVLNISAATPNNRYPMIVRNLSPFTNYSCNATIVNDWGTSPETTFEFITEQEVPPKPESIVILNQGSHDFTVQWTAPKEIPGILTSYTLSVFSNGTPSDFPFDECSINNITENFPIDPSITTYHFVNATPYHNYIVSVVAIDGAGEGEPATLEVTTHSAEPDPVKNAVIELTYSTTDNYNAIAQIKIDPSCTNGPFKHFEISYNGKRDNFEDDDHTNYITETSTKIDLLPERNYSFSVKVANNNYTSEPFIVTPFCTHPGVPILRANLTSPSVDGIKATFIISKKLFDNINGEIIAYALILLTSSTSESKTFDFWNGTNETWPTVLPNAKQLTGNFWNPFEDGRETENYVVPNLKADTDYWLLVRALTRAAYKDSFPLHFKTDMSNKLPLILGLTFGLLALLIFVVFLIFLWRRKRKTTTYDEEKRFSTSAPAPVPVQKFNNYFLSIKENYNIVKQQYTDLGLQSKDVALPISYATLVENKRKNRYTNILPFDETRVKLKIDEDDEISSDYINASYIKGYSGKIEYIATQGPLASTTRDFWKMILQENVSIIVMVSQFVEQNKEKCHQYFPNNHESVNFGELDVKCSTELHFGTYCIRTLQVRKGTEQRNVIHMQFLEWPDFGVPQGTDNMLQFSNQLREKANTEGGLIVVHCSAGVGRTGTLIALDILLQTIDDHRDINIYKTVFDLRKQRVNMVQTEKQYMFIHACVKEYIETPTSQTNDRGQERIYENVDVLKSSSLKKNLIETEVESAL